MAVSVSSAGAGVFGTVAFPADFGVVVYAEVLRLCIGRASNLQDNTVAIAFRQRLLCDKRVCRRLKLELRFTGRSLRDQRHCLSGGRNGVHRLSVEGHAYLLVRLHEEFRVPSFNLDDFSALRPGDYFVVVMPVFAEDR